MLPRSRLSLTPFGPARGVAFLLGAATALRLVLLHTPFLWPDESVVATMGLEVLRGGLPVYYHGQPFMGALHAYLVAPLYVVLGPSAFAIELLAVLVTVAWLLVMARLAWVTFGPRVALFATALLALPPNLLLYWSHEARPQYLLTLLFGTLALLLAHNLPALSPARATLAVTLVGGLLGLAAWTNFLAVVYGPALALLVVPTVVRRRLFGAGLAGLLAFVLASLPHWLYGLPHGTALPSPGGSVGTREVAEHLESLARVSWPALAGVPAPWRDTPAGMGLALLLALAYVVAAVVAFRKADGARRRMNIALCAIVAADVAAAMGTPFGRFLPGPDQRLLLPVYTALPLFLAQWLSGQAVARAVVLTAALLLAHLVDATAPGDVRVRRRVLRASRPRGGDGGRAGADPGGPRARGAAQALRRRSVDAGADVPLGGARDLLRSLPGDLPAVRARRGRGGVGRLVDPAPCRCSRPTWRRWASASATARGDRSEARTGTSRARRRRSASSTPIGCE